MSKKLLIIAALVLPLMALLIVFVAAHPADDTLDRVERLQPLRIDQLAQRPIGSEVLLEGTIGIQSITKYHSFVAYFRERHYHDVDLSDQWQREATESGAFILQLANGTVSITSAGYQIVNPTTVEPTPDHQQFVFTRYSGFQLGDSVTLIGTLTSAGSHLSVKADVVIGGTRAAYLAADARITTWSVVFIGLSIALVAMFALALYFARRQSHRPTPAAA